MDKKYDPLFIGISILGLLCSGYALYRTLSDQILSRNQGFIYATVFGFILFLVFLLCNLFTKLIATSNTSHKGFVIRIVAWGILAFLGAIFVYFRLRYSNSVEAWDSLFFKNAQAMNTENYLANRDLIIDGIKNPSLYVYSLVLSYIFSVFGEASSVMVITNIVFCVLSGILLHLITSMLSDRFSSLFTIGLAVFMPTTNFVVYSYTGETFFTFIFLVNLYIFTLLYVRDQKYGLAYDLLPYGDAIIARKKEEKRNQENKNNNNSELTNSSDNKNNKHVLLKNTSSNITSGEDIIDNPKIDSILLTVLLAIAEGLLIFTEPVTIFLLIGFILVAFLSKKETAFNIFAAIAGALVLFSIFTFGKSVHLNEDFGSVIAGEANSFNFFDEFTTGEKSDFSKVISNFNYELATTDTDVTSNYRGLINSEGINAFSDAKITWIIVANQIIYMFLLVMFISGILIAFYLKKTDIVLPIALFLSSLFIIFFQQNRINNKNFFINILIISCGMSIHYLYLNHHPELKPVVSAVSILSGNNINNNKQDQAVVATIQTPTEEEEFIRRAQALIFVGTDENLYHQIKEEEQKKALSEGRVKALDNTFDDYDEDYFLDNSDEDKSNAPQKLPVAVVTNFKIKNKEDLLDISGAVKAKTESTGSSEQNDSYIEKSVDKPTEIISKPSLKSDNKEKEDNKNRDEDRYIPNPLPVPKKKTHEPIDFDIQTSDGGWDWDVDFDVKADDDF